MLHLSRYGALLVAWVAMCGSLFFSEVIGWPPCILCWYQRILMYPLAAVIAIGILRRDNGLHLYVLPFSFAGACIACYHYLLVKTTWLPPPPCHTDVPCTADYLNWFGFINIPFLAFAGFVLISGMMLLSMRAPFVEHIAEQPMDDEEATALTRAPQATFQAADIAVLAIIAGVVLTFVVGARLL